VADIFQEVDEEVRREQLQKLWQRYGHFAIAGCILIVVAVGGWRGYDWWQAKKANESGAAFEAAVALAETGKHQEAEAAFAKLATGGTASYRTLARLREAAELARTDKAGRGSSLRRTSQPTRVPARSSTTWRRCAGLLVGRHHTRHIPKSVLGSSR